MDKNEQKIIHKESEVFFENWNKIDKILGEIGILLLILSMIYTALK